MNHGNLIESLENRQLFASTAFASAITVHNDGLHMNREPNTTAIIGDLHQPMSYSFGANQTAVGFQWGVGRG